MCPGFKKLGETRSETLNTIKVARMNWEDKRDSLQLWKFLEYYYMAWFEDYALDFDIPATEFIRQLKEAASRIFLFRF